MNKKGNMIMIIGFFVLLFLILFIGVILAVGGAVINFVGDEATPILEDLGMIGSANLTDIATFTVAPLNDFVQQSTWLTGVLYVLLLFLSIAMIVAVRLAPSKWLLGVYFFLVLVLILGSILISNIYQDFYNDAGDLGERLREQVMISFLILYSPLVFAVISFVTGIFLFSGIQQQGEFV